MFTSRNFVFSWLFLLSSCFVFSQHLRFRHITTEEGLSANFVRAILRDDKGFMWFGTQDGLNKYDGYSFRVFRHEPDAEPSLPASDITALLQVRRDLIIVGTRNGLSFLNPYTETFSSVPLRKSGVPGKVNALLMPDSGSVLVGTELGLFELKLPGNTVRELKFPGGPVNVKCLQTIGNSIYVGTLGSGLWQLDGLNPVRQTITVPEHMKIDTAAFAHISAIAVYAGKLYLGTHGSGIFKVDASLEVEARFSFAHLHAYCDVVNDLVLKNNRAYIASAHGVIVHNLISGETQFYDRQDRALAMNANAANCILMDDQNNFWIGTEQGGVNIAFSRLLRFPLSNTGYESRFANVSAILELPGGALMLGADDKLWEVDPSGNATDYSALIGGEGALCIVEENEDAVWVGTRSGGIWRVDRKARMSRQLVETTGLRAVTSIVTGGDYLYAGFASGALLKIHRRSFTIRHYGDSQGLLPHPVNGLFIDAAGNIWLSSADAGLVKIRPFDGGGKLNIEKIYQNNGQKGHIASNIVFDVNQDLRKNIWVTTSLGLSKLKPDGTFRNFHEKHGLSGTYLHAIRRDSAGGFWMSSNTGIIYFDPLVPEDEITFRNYSLRDGLLNSEYNRGAAHSAPGGMMYFGGPKGFNAFRPSTIRNNLHTPAVFITGYKRAGLDVPTDTVIAYKKHLQLNWTEDHFQMEAAALDFTDPENNKFRYMLEGYDRQWSAPTKVRYISYTELPGGNYTLRVKAANNDGIWNDKPYELRITVVPPFWKTTAFYMIVGVAGLGLIYGFTQYRTRAVKTENRLLEQKVAQRTRELESKNRDIMSSIEYARRIQEALLPAREHIFRKLSNIFILYRPKDIVSGDFYWFAEKDGWKIFAVVDCTGHGVPGAFMSMIGHNLLHQIVTEKGLTDPSEILNELHRGVLRALRQGDNEINTNDGMDVSIICIRDTPREVRWAGANRPLVIIERNGRFTRFNGNKYPVGGAQTDANRVFTSHIVQPEGPSMAYLFTDGYADQFGGSAGKKFMVRRFHDLLMKVHRLSAAEQSRELERNFEQWKQQHEQVDDVLIAGIEI